jgi:hypothetical protein
MRQPVSLKVYTNTALSLSINTQKGEKGGIYLITQIQSTTQ